MKTSFLGTKFVAFRTRQPHATPNFAKQIHVIPYPCDNQAVSHTNPGRLTRSEAPENAHRTGGGRVGIRQWMGWATILGFSVQWKMRDCSTRCSLPALGSRCALAARREAQEALCGSRRSHQPWQHFLAFK